MDGRLDRSRLALVVDRFASPHDGERLAALEAAGRILATGGLSWRELIDGAAEADTDKDEPVEAHHYHQLRVRPCERADAVVENYRGGVA